MKMTSIFKSAIPFWVLKSGRLKSILTHSAPPPNPSPLCRPKTRSSILVAHIHKQTFSIPTSYQIHTLPPQTTARSAAAAANTYIDIQNWCNLYYYYYYRASRDHEIHIQSNLAIRNWNRKDDLFILCLLQCILRIYENQKGKEEHVKVRDLVPEVFDSGPMCITDLFQNKSVAYFNPK